MNFSIFAFGMRSIKYIIPVILLTLAQRGGADTVSLIVKRDDPYGQTFLDWFGFQSSELGQMKKGHAATAPNRGICCRCGRGTDIDITQFNDGSIVPGPNSNR